MRLLALIAVVVLAGCGGGPAPAVADPTTEAWYGETVQQLTGLNQDAERSLAGGDPERAAADITSGLPLEKRLISVSRPTLAATVAVSDLDRLYGRMLLANRNVGWARLTFQKNLARWRNWRPETADSARRLQQARDDIAECDKRLP